MRETMKSAVLFSVLSLVVLSSACTGGSRSSSEVLSFSEFRFANPVVTDKDQAEFIYEVQNVGGKDVTFAKLFLYGFQNVDFEKLGHSPVTLADASTLRLKAPTKEGAKGDRQAGTIFFDLFETRDASGKSIFSSPQGTEQQYALQGRLVYNYSAETNAAFSAITREEYLQERQRGKEPKSRPINLRSLSGPIQVTVKTEQPVIFYSDNPSNPVKKTRMLFTIENRGTGVPLPSFDESSKQSAFDLNNTNKLGKMSLLINGNSYPCGDANQASIPLFNNRAEIYCDILLSDPVVEQSYQVEAAIPYYYVVDRQTTLTVQGTEIEE